MNGSRKLVAALMLALSPIVAVACGGDDAAGEPEITHPNGNESLGPADAKTNGYLREPAPQVGKISLPELTADGKPFTLSAKPDGLLLVFFGFTNCPDVCPTTMAHVSQAMNRLDPADAERVELAMVTVDPARDLKALPKYVRGFVPDGHALGTKDEAKLRSAAEAFGVSYAVKKKADGKVDVGHSSHLFGVDDTGAMVITWPFNTGPEGIAEDLEKLLHDNV